MDDVEDDELGYKIDSICEVINEIVNGDNPRNSFPDIFEYIDNELNDKEYE